MEVGAGRLRSALRCVSMATVIHGQTWQTVSERAAPAFSLANVLTASRRSAARKSVCQDKQAFTASALFTAFDLETTRRGAAGEK